MRSIVLFSRRFLFPSLCFLPGSDFEDRRHILRMMEETEHLVAGGILMLPSNTWFPPVDFIYVTNHCVVKTRLLGLSIICCLHKLSFLFPHIFFLLWAHFFVYLFVIPILSYFVTHSLFSGGFHFLASSICNPLCLLHRAATRYSPPPMIAVATLSVPSFWPLHKMLYILQFFYFAVGSH